MNEINLKEVEQLIKTATEFRDKEKEKFRVGSIWKESIEALRVTIASLEQLRSRGEKVDSARQSNIQNLRKIVLNLLEIGGVLGLANNSGATLLKSQIDAKFKAEKAQRKQALKSVRQEGDRLS